MADFRYIPEKTRCVQKLDTPIIQAPSAAQGLAHEKGEADTAKGVAAAGSIFSISTYANTTIKDASA